MYACRHSNEALNLSADAPPFLHEKGAKTPSAG